MDHRKLGHTISTFRSRTTMSSRLPFPWIRHVSTCGPSVWFLELTYSSQLNGLCPPPCKLQHRRKTLRLRSAHSSACDQITRTHRTSSYTVMGYHLLHCPVEMLVVPVFQYWEAVEDCYSTLNIRVFKVSQIGRKKGSTVVPRDSKPSARLCQDVDDRFPTLPASGGVRVPANWYSF